MIPRVASLLDPIQDGHQDTFLVLEFHHFLWVLDQIEGHFVQFSHVVGLDEHFGHGLEMFLRHLLVFFLLKSLKQLIINGDGLLGLDLGIDFAEADLPFGKV